MTELAALGIPVLLIPLPWAGQQEQMENARILSEAGTAVILPQEKLNGETLYQCIESLIQNIDKYQKNSRNAQRLINLKAVDKLIEIINKFLLRNKKGCR
ncbi:MAG: UDP-N-acetylglucosamine--N-acetylmuramyl-(pentapeptide) pyrophosphoryl-undecaprenol N-acetylglucosamine transferase [Microgenomates group bacterium LiPW_16]|nr:MAG: UDP-N-acetylglucosamine--N-acetylmuramyl-(pentapeptide) pyrophosphoryl-undecaprenol N-acetylglucosamine transferase [Microgenomates group bacterium LiPW_16]